MENTGFPSVTFYSCDCELLADTYEALNDQYKSNKHPIAVIFVIYRKESKAKRNFAIDGHVNYMCMIQNL